MWYYLAFLNFRRNHFQKNHVIKDCCVIRKNVMSRGSKGQNIHSSSTKRVSLTLKQIKLDELSFH